MSELENAIEALKTDGYYRFRGVYDEADVKKGLALIREWYDRSKNACSDHVPFLNIDQPTVYNLQNKDFFFLELLFKPKIVHQVLMHFMNDKWFKQIPADQPNYLIRSYIARSSNKRMPMHLDSFVPYVGQYPFVMQYSIILQDQGPHNGCTVVVPGSHRTGEYATQESYDTAVPLESEAGDVVMWDSRLWHGTTENTSDDTRWAIVATYCRWWLKQHWNVVQNLPQENYSKLTDAQKAVLGFCSIPHSDETMGIDLKAGYQDLSPEVDTYRSPPDRIDAVYVGGE